MQTADVSGGVSGGIALQEHEGENLPPLEFEPGVAGAAQKGVSAVVIAFGAAAFGAIAYGAYVALFPGATSTQSIYSEAFEHVRMDPDVSYALGSPLKAFGMDARARGSRSNMERWEVVENEEELSIVRFFVQGPQGAGIVQVQTPKNRRKGDFKYIVFRNARTRATKLVLDTRGGDAGAPTPAVVAPPAEGASEAPPPPPAPLAPSSAAPATP